MQSKNAIAVVHVMISIHTLYGGALFGMQALKEYALHDEYYHISNSVVYM